jgi:putative oxidoreductase
MGFIKRKEVILLLRLIVGVTFVYASFEKIFHPNQFAIAVRSYQIIPVSLSNLFALSILWGELVAAILLIVGLFTRQAAAAILLLTAMFTFAIGIVLVKGMVIDCGCFGPDGGTPVGPPSLIRNILLIAACVLIMRYDRGFFSLNRLIPARSS